MNVNELTALSHSRWVYKQENNIPVPLKYSFFNVLFYQSFIFWGGYKNMFFVCKNSEKLTEPAKDYMKQRFREIKLIQNLQVMYRIVYVA